MTFSPATAAANFFTLDRLAASSTWCGKEGKAEGTTAAAAFVSLEKKQRMKTQTGIFAKKLISDHWKGYTIF